jgi:hypothetical protein
MLVRAIAILAHASFGFAFHSNTVDLATFFVAHHAAHIHLASRPYSSCQRRQQQKQEQTCRPF